MPEPLQEISAQLKKIAWSVRDLEGVGKNTKDLKRDVEVLKFLVKKIFDKLEDVRRAERMESLLKEILKELKKFNEPEKEESE